MSGKGGKSSGVFAWINLACLLLLSIVTLYPLWHVVSLSLSSAAEAGRGGLFLWPRDASWQAYAIVFSSEYMGVAFRNSAFVTIVGALLSTFLTAATAYPLIKSGLPGRKAVVFLILFTMLFGGGVIPSYLLVKELGLINSLWALILPTAINAFNVLVMRSFFLSLPGELEESATMDGANPIWIFFRIVLPLSMPVLATIVLWEAVGLWNNFFQAFIYLNELGKYTLPVLVRDIISNQEMAAVTGQFSEASSDSVIAATIVVSLVPIVCVYPVLQKYFVKGVMLGAVKQ